MNPFISPLPYLKAFVLLPYLELLKYLSWSVSVSTNTFRIQNNTVCTKWCARISNIQPNPKLHNSCLEWNGYTESLFEGKKSWFLVNIPHFFLRFVTCTKAAVLLIWMLAILRGKIGCRFYWYEHFLKPFVYYVRQRKNLPLDWGINPFMFQYRLYSCSFIFKRFGFIMS